LFAYDIAQLLIILGFERCSHWRFLCILACFVWIWLSIYCNLDNLFAVYGIVVVDCSPKFLRGTGQTTDERGRSSYVRGVW